MLLFARVWGFWVSLGKSDSLCGSGGGAERRGRRDGPATPGHREARVLPQRQPLALGLPIPRGPRLPGGAFPTDRDPSSRRGGGYDAPRTPIVSAAPPRGERTRCTGVARARGTVSTSARPLPSRAPSLTSGHPAYLRVQLGHRHGRERTARGLRRCKARGLGRRLCGPGAGNLRCGPRKSALSHLAEEVFQNPINFAEGWRPRRREVADWSFPARGEASLWLAGRGLRARRPSSGRVPAAKWVHLAGPERSAKNPQGRGFAGSRGRKQVCSEAFPTQVLAPLGLNVLIGKSRGYNHLHRKSKRINH